ncbi:MAG: YcxB family protein [Clostridia bacterium]|nr:YcxB family protein [Clostridia bacterium]
MADTIVVHVRMDTATFRRFSWFDMFALRRRWRRPASFALILGAFAAVALLSGRAQSGLIAAVLLAVGLGLPLVWFGSFLSQVNAQAVRLRLDPPRHVYDVTLDENGVRVQNVMKQEMPVEVRWDEARAAFRVRGCVYLYVSPAQAFLMPDGQAEAGDAALWDCLTAHMGDRCRDRRAGRGWTTDPNRKWRDSQ